MSDEVIFDENCKHAWKKRECKIGSIVVATWDVCTKCKSERNRKTRGIEY